MLILSNWLTGGVHLCLFYLIVLLEALVNWRHSFMLILSNWLTGGVHLCLFYLIG